MPVLTVKHLTTYRYKQPVAFGEHRMMLRPRDYYDQKLLEAKLVITPEPSDIRWVHDVFGNCVAVARFSGRAQELRFESAIRLLAYNPQAPDQLAALTQQERAIARTVIEGMTSLDAERRTRLLAGLTSQ